MKKFIALFSILLFFMLIGIVATPAFASPVSVESILTLNPYAKLGDTIVTNNYTVSQTSTINPLNGFASAVTTNGSASYTTELNISANWNDMSSGSVVFDGTIISENFPDGPYGLGNFCTAGPNTWSYQFIPDTDGIFTLECTNTFSSLVNNINGSVVSEGTVGFQYYFSNYGLWRNMHSDTLTADISNGIPFEVKIGWENSSPAMGGIGPLTLNLDGSFNWHFDTAPVPIPSTMWLLGSGLIGLVGFRKKFKKASQH